MLSAALQKEWRLLRRDGRLSWLLLSLLAMMLLAMATSGYQYHQQYLLKSQVQEAERSRWDQQGEKNPHSAAHYGIYLLKPQSPLATIDPGLNDYLGQIVFLEAHNRNAASFAGSQDAIELQRLGRLSPALLWQWLLPLFVILAGYGFFAAERDQGTLRMLLLSGLTARQVVCQKALALASFTLVFVLPLGVYCGALLIIGDAVEVDRLLVMVALYLGYLLLWLLLTLAFSLLAKTAQQALIALLLVWGLCTLIIPKLAIDQAERAAPVLSAKTFYARMESDLYTPERLAAIAKFKTDTLAQHGVESTEDLPFNWSGAELLFNEDYSDAVFDRLFNHQLAQLQRQDQRYQAFSVLSPLISVQSLSSALAGTDWYHHQQFASAAEDYRRQLVSYLNHAVRDHTSGDPLGDNELWQSIPEFHYRPPAINKLVSIPSGSLASHYAKALLGTLVWLALALALWVLGARRLHRQGAL